MTKNTNGGVRQGSGRPKGSRNSTIDREMPKQVKDGLEGLVEQLRELRKKIEYADARDNPKEEGFVKSLVCLRGSVLRQLIPYRFAKQATETKLETASEAPKKPISITLTRPPKKKTTEETSDA